MPEIIPNNPNLEREIEVLEKKLAEKKAALSEVKQFPAEREIAREVVEERVAEQIAAVIPAAAKAKPASSKINPVVLPAKVSAAALKNTPQNKQIDILLGVAFSDSIASAVILAQKMENPYVLDAVHDALVDKFYNELVKRGKIN